MNISHKKQERTNGIKVVGAALSSFPLLSWRLFFGFLRLKRQAKKAGKTFKKELRKQGFDKDIAEDLTQLYLRSSRLHTYFNFFI
jgi:hypothetical protein